MLENKALAESLGEPTPDFTKPNLAVLNKAAGNEIIAFRVRLLYEYAGQLRAGDKLVLAGLGHRPLRLVA